MDWQAIWLSVRLAAATTAILLVVGLPIAYWLAFSPRRWKFLVEAVVSLPLVLPPTVLHAAGTPTRLIAAFSEGLVRGRNCTYFTPGRSFSAAAASAPATRTKTALTSSCEVALTRTLRFPSAATTAACAARNFAVCACACLPAIAAREEMT